MLFPMILSQKVYNICIFREFQAYEYSMYETNFIFNICWYFWSVVIDESLSENGLFHLFLIVRKEQGISVVVADLVR